jgi:glycosyltransferase involved in cell wall biosynthesis
MAERPVVICFGPGPKFKGGISNYNTSLALALEKQGAVVHIVSWTQQYPAIIPREFVDKSSKTDFLGGSVVQVKYITNYNNPFSWNETVDYMLSLNPDKIIFQWSIALQGLPIGSMIKKLRKKSSAEVIVDLHFVVQKENSNIDRYFTRRGISNASTYVVHALKTYDELKTLFPSKHFHLSLDGVRVSNQVNVIKLFHPIYDLFKPDPTFDVEKFKRDHGLRKNVFLFFGFIRKYKGLHQAIEAFSLVAKQRADVSLLICGESFWNTLDPKSFTAKTKSFLFGIAKKIFLKNQEDEKNYRPLELIEKLGIKDRCVVFNSFIPNEDVHKYFQVSDCVVLYYLTATPSGVESLSYNFELPILATRVGHFPETIRHGFNGYLANGGDVDDMAKQMLNFLDHPLPRENVSSATSTMSWQNYAASILNDLNRPK